jgi:2-hydroxychromene-2-carboxylate isomerase
MTAPLEFYFDFTSPYGYFGAEQIETLVARNGRTVNWHPVLLGVIFKATGQIPLLSVPLKGEYSGRDLQRISRLTGIPFKLPTPFPVSTAAAARAFLFAGEADAAMAKQLGLALYRAFFVNGRNIGDTEVVLDVCAEQGLDRAEAAIAIESQAIKDQLRAGIVQAQGLGVFGSPYVIVDGEPFWGWDRFPMIETWLQRGGF